MGRHKNPKRGWEQSDMPLFVSDYTNKLDKKGRVSIPALFRTELERVGFSAFVAFPHPTLDCFEAWDRERMGRFAEGMDEYRPMSAEYVAASKLLRKSKEVVFGPEGRAVLPEVVINVLKLEDEVTFAGCGQTFQLWHPKRYKEYDAETEDSDEDLPDDFRLAPPRRGSDG